VGGPSNERMRLVRIGKRLAAGASAVMLGAGLVLAMAAPASADYGKGAVRQIEISANTPGVQGGGVWLWIELSPTTSPTSGTGDYQGSDCGHGANGGAVHDSGTATWTETGGVITITGVTLNGLGGFPTTITVPWNVGHYSYTGVGAVLTLPGFIPPTAGFTQLQVAP